MPWSLDLRMAAELRGGASWPPDLVDAGERLAPYPPDLLDVDGCQALYLFMARIEELDHSGGSASVEDSVDGWRGGSARRSWRRTGGEE
jgi:hypothetical protein